MLKSILFVIFLFLSQLLISAYGWTCILARADEGNFIAAFMVGSVVMLVCVTTGFFGGKYALKLIIKNNSQVADQGMNKINPK